REVVSNDKVVKDLPTGNPGNNKGDHETSLQDKTNPIKGLDNSEGIEEKKDTLIKNTNTQTSENEESSLLVKNDNDSNDILHKKINTPRKNKFINSFALAFSLGPDVSAVRPSNIGRIKTAYGAGLSYQL